MGDYLSLVCMWLYVILPLVALHFGWPIRACLAMLVTALPPFLVWLSDDTPSGPLDGLIVPITAAMLALALVPLTYGILRLRRRRI